MFNQKGSGLIIGILVGLLIAGGLFGAYYLGAQKNETIPAPQPVVQKVAENPPPPQTPTPNPTPADINGFPVYPDAVFVGTKDYPPCVEGQYSGFSICNAKAHTWQVEANNDLVSAFYRKDESKSGWICSGGAGDYTDADNASVTTSCKKGILSYGLSIDTKNGSTTLTLTIPQGTPTGE